MAQYPEKPIEMIVAFASGGGTDVATRSIARFMEKHLGEGASPAVINKPGARSDLFADQSSRDLQALISLAEQRRSAHPPGTKADPSA